MQQYLRTLIDEDMGARRQQFQDCGPMHSFKNYGTNAHYQNVGPFTCAPSFRGHYPVPVKPWSVAAEELEEFGMDPFHSGFPSIQRYGGHMNSPFHKSYLNSFLANDLACGLGGHIQDNIHCGMTGYQRPFLGGGHLMNAMRHMHNVHPIEKLNVTKELMEDRQRDEFQTLVEATDAGYGATVGPCGVEYCGRGGYGAYGFGGDCGQFAGRRGYCL
ncbi:hypothetical protein BC830DRAFT_787547 [Chytriomyces sp. MP71]|nr:hypothetical protein BC830DRAFT_787547 [Chytriomyces sp. MP71]